MKRLVIHPKDASTDFLSRVYRDLPDVTLVTGGISAGQVRNMAFEADQVIMLGHGTPFGLMSMGQFSNSGGYVVGDDFADVLAEKDNSIFIWCNADQYVKYNELKGFYTGMFVSEVNEAFMMGLGNTPKWEVDQSNHAFVDTIGRFAEHTTNVMHAAAKHEYGQLAMSNVIASYNNDRLYVS